MEVGNGHGLASAAGTNSQLLPVARICLRVVCRVWGGPEEATSVPEYLVCACPSTLPLQLPGQGPHPLLPGLGTSQEPNPRPGPHRMNSWKAFTTCLVASGMCTVSKGAATAHVPPLYLLSRQPTVLSSPSTPTPTRNSHLLRYSVCRREGGKGSHISTLLAQHRKKHHSEQDTLMGRAGKTRFYFTAVLLNSRKKKKKSGKEDKESS